MWAHSAILDGELVPGTGRLLELHGPAVQEEWPFCLAFGLLAAKVEYIRSLPLLTRKAALRQIMPRIDSRLRYLDHIEARGIDLFRVASSGDLEGIVGKLASGSYLSDRRRTSASGCCSLPVRRAARPGGFACIILRPLEG